MTGDYSYFRDYLDKLDSAEHLKDTFDKLMAELAAQSSRLPVSMQCLNNIDEYTDWLILALNGCRQEGISPVELAEASLAKLVTNRQQPKS